VLGECLNLLDLGDVIAHGFAEMAVVMAAVFFPLLFSVGKKTATSVCSVKSVLLQFTCWHEIAVM